MSLVLKKEWAYRRGCSRNSSRANSAKPAVAEQAEGEQPAEEAAGEEEQVGQQMAAEIDGAAVGEAEQPLDQDQRRFERRSVVPPPEHRHVTRWRLTARLLYLT